MKPEATMLYEFLEANRDELVRRCRERVSRRPEPQPSPAELQYGIPLFLEQLITTLRLEHRSAGEGSSQLPEEIGVAAGRHGGELLRQGFTIEQVVHDYGDLCQSVTELAAEKRVPVTVDEFRTFNLCLDNAIADAVTEFGYQRDRVKSAEGEQEMSVRLGSLAHELRNLLNTAILAFDAIKSGHVAVTGATGGVLDRSLLALRGVIDRTLADVRLSAGLEAHIERIVLHEFLEELGVSAALDAKAKGIGFTVDLIDKGLVVEADRPMLGSAVSNLLQNAFKFTRSQGHVSLAVRSSADRVLIDVEDECGGLPDGTAEALFRPFEQRSRNRSGVGLGLSISRRAVEANGGTLGARNLPGKGCVFTIELPRIATRD